MKTISVHARNHFYHIMQFDNYFLYVEKTCCNQYAAWHRTSAHVVSPSSPWQQNWYQRSSTDKMNHSGPNESSLSLQGRFFPSIFNHIMLFLYRCSAFTGRGMNPGAYTDNNYRVWMKFILYITSLKLQCILDRDISNFTFIFCQILEKNRKTTSAYGWGNSGFHSVEKNSICNKGKIQEL